MTSPDTPQPHDDGLEQRVFRLVALAEHSTWDRYTLGQDICHGIDKRVPEIIALVAKAQREADVAALEANAASRRYGGQIPQWAADYLCSLPLISEEGATRG